MSIRIRRTGAKIGVVIGGYALVFLVGFLSGAVLGPEAPYWTAPILSLALIAFCTRVFRGGGEPVSPPRPWWKLTAGPPSAFIIAALFGTTGIYSLLALSFGVQATTALVPALYQTVVGAAFLGSGIAQHRLGNPRRWLE